jgi:hypothetical protein
MDETETKIAELLAEFYEAREVAAWLMSPNDLLGGEKACVLIANDRADEVLACLQRLADGVYI